MDLRPATIGWAVAVGGALAWDVELERRNLDRPDDDQLGLLSDVARTPAGWVVVAVIVAHFAGVLGRADPFHLVGATARWVQRLVRRVEWWSTAGAHLP